jgi:transglutaminase-like putative cysteine protease
MPAKPQRYRIVHETGYVYGGRIDLCHSLCCLRPRETAFQATAEHAITVEPKPEVTVGHLDFFGNHRDLFTVQHAHGSLKVRAVSEVRVSPDPRPWELPFSDPPWDETAASLLSLRGAALREIAAFRLSSPATPPDPDLRAYAAASFPPGAGLLASCRDFMARIHRDFRYAPGTTAIHTTVRETFARREGVCQDFAHLFLAALRDLGLAARYVSGYLETEPPPGKPRLQGADASHAWIEVQIPGLDWVPFDPTNDVLPGPRHVVAAVGRDYFDVQPLRGIFLGSGGQSLTVRVDVARL